MKKEDKKKLTLKHETIRHLNEQTLRELALGANVPLGCTSYTIITISIDGC